MKLVLVSFKDGHFECFNCDEIQFYDDIIDVLCGGVSVHTLAFYSVVSFKIIR